MRCNTDGLGGYDAMRYKSKKDKILHRITCTWNLKNTANE